MKENREDRILLGGNRIGERGARNWEDEREDGKRKFKDKLENAEGLMEWIEEMDGSRGETVIDYGIVNEEAWERVEELRIEERAADHLALGEGKNREGKRDIPRHLRIKIRSLGALMSCNSVKYCLLVAATSSGLAVKIAFSPVLTFSLEARLRNSDKNVEGAVVQEFMENLGGLWPSGGKYSPKNIYTGYALICFIFIVISHNLSQLVNVCFIYDQLETLTASIVVMLSEVTGMVKFYLFHKNIRVVKDLMTMLEGDLFQPKTTRQRVMLRGSLNTWKKIYVVFSLSAVMTIFLWGLHPLVDGSYKNQELPFLAWYPYCYRASPQYQLTYVYQVVANFFIAITNQNIDAFISALLMYTATQCEMLCDDLANLVGTDRRNFGRCVKHHQEILRFAQSTNQFLSVMTFGQFANSVVAICMTMFQLSVVTPFTPDFYTLVCCQSACFTQVFVYCWFGNEVMIKSSNISFSAYESGFWIDSSIALQKDLVFFLMRCCKPIQLRAVNFFGLSLQSFTSILRTSWSYFALLQQMNKK
ncbi:hypothetical protein GEV33_014566 [Tenebrio molitor]|nr:hypothetical protein GEV33_014566 [Tenebrio molitor]